MSMRATLSVVLISGIVLLSPPAEAGKCECQTVCTFPDNTSTTDSWTYSNTIIGNLPYIYPPNPPMEDSCKAQCEAYGNLLDIYSRAKEKRSCGEVKCTSTGRIVGTLWPNKGKSKQVTSTTRTETISGDWCAKPPASDPHASCCPLSDRQDVSSTVHQIQTTDVNDPFQLLYMANANRDKRLQNYLNYVAGENPKIGSLHVDYKLYDVSSGLPGTHLTYGMVFYDLNGAGVGYPGKPFFKLPAGMLKVNTLYRVMTEIILVPAKTQGSYTPISYASPDCKTRGFEFMIYYKELKTAGRAATRIYYAKITEDGVTREMELAIPSKTSPIEAEQTSRGADVRTFKPGESAPNDRISADLNRGEIERVIIEHGDQ